MKKLKLTDSLDREIEFFTDGNEIAMDTKEAVYFFETDQTKQLIEFLTKQIEGK